MIAKTTLESTDTVIGGIHESLKALADRDWKAQVIIADCPWDYERDCGYKGGNGSGSRLDITPKYGKMSVNELCSLAPLIGRIVDPLGCLLYMWATNAFDKDAHDVATAWGFYYMRTQYTWVKSFNGAGTGRVSRHDTEHVKMFFRGGGWVGHDLKAMKAYGKKLSSTAISASRPKDENGKTIHSAKPDFVHRLAESEHSVRYRRTTKGKLPLDTSTDDWEPYDYLTNRLEMFGRCDRPGWIVIGDRQ